MSPSSKSTSHCPPPPKQQHNKAPKKPNNRVTLKSQQITFAKQLHKMMTKVQGTTSKPSRIQSIMIFQLTSMQNLKIRKTLSMHKNRGKSETFQITEMN